MPGEERKTYNYHLHALQHTRYEAQAQRRESRIGDDRCPPAPGHGETTQDSTGQDSTGHTTRPDPTRRDTIRHKTKTSSPVRAGSLTLAYRSSKRTSPCCRCYLWAHVWMEDSVDAERLSRPGVGWWAGGLAGSLAISNTWPCLEVAGRDRPCCHGRGTEHSSITTASAGQLSGPHRPPLLTCFDCPHATRCMHCSAAQCICVCKS